MRGWIESSGKLGKTDPSSYQVEKMRPTISFAKIQAHTFIFSGYSVCCSLIIRGFASLQYVQLCLLTLPLRESVSYSAGDLYHFHSILARDEAY